MKSASRLLLECALIISFALALVFASRMLRSPQQNREREGVITQDSPLATGGKTTTALEGKNAEGAFPGFTIYPTSGTAEVLLVNMSGKTVHKWNVDADRARLLPNCNLLVVHGSKWGIEHEPWASMRPIIREYTWTGETAWEYTLPQAAHHDIQKLPDGNILALYLTDVPDYLKQNLNDPKLRGVSIRSDVVVEIRPDKSIAWEWAAHDHLDLNSCGYRSCEELRSRKIAGRRRLDWTHMNAVSVLPENKWYDNGDQRFRPGNVLIFARNWWTAMIIDRETKKVVWQYHGDYKGGIVGGHEPVMIPKGHPGAGNILIFDNGRASRESKVLEINPTTKKLAWVYEDGKAFYSVVAGAAQRLPNGNTLISEDVTGKVFEVNSDKKLVWEYKGRDMRINRARRYPANHCNQLEGLPVE